MAVKPGGRTMGGGGRARQQMEARLGALGTGARVLIVGGHPYTLAELMRTLGLAFDDNRPIDAHELISAVHFAIRYFDGEERRIVAYEFDQEFRYLGETRVHIAEWMGDEYYEFGWGEWCPWTL